MVGSPEHGKVATARLIQNTPVPSAGLQNGAPSHAVDVLNMMEKIRSQRLL
jgi:hypothetical protein